MQVYGENMNVILLNISTKYVIIIVMQKLHQHE